VHIKSLHIVVIIIIIIIISRGQAHGRPRTNWSGVVKKEWIYEKTGHTSWKEVEAADENDVGMWRNASAWKRVKSRLNRDQSITGLTIGGHTNERRGRLPFPLSSHFLPSHSFTFLSF